jgi:hypothetical protein
MRYAVGLTPAPPRGRALRREREAGPHAAIREGGVRMEVGPFPPSLLARADHVIDQ